MYRVPKNWNFKNLKPFNNDFAKSSIAILYSKTLRFWLTDCLMYQSYKTFIDSSNYETFKQILKLKLLVQKLQKHFSLSLTKNRLFLQRLTNRPRFLTVMVKRLYKFKICRIYRQELSFIQLDNFVLFIYSFLHPRSFPYNIFRTVSRNPD